MESQSLINSPCVNANYLALQIELNDDFAISSSASRQRGTHIEPRCPNPIWIVFLWLIQRMYLVGCAEVLFYVVK